MIAFLRRLFARGEIVLWKRDARRLRDRDAAWRRSIAAGATAKSKAC
jgi:hypothetical protein